MPWVLAAALAACQPLPHPFADDRPPAALLRVGDVTSVAVAPVVGAPEATAAKLGAAVADALLKHDIAASAKTTSLGSYQLYGRVGQLRPQGGEAGVEVLWRLYDAAGHAVGDKSAKLEAPAAEWAAGNSETINRLAALSADALAPLLVDESQPQALKLAAAEEKLRVAVRQIRGAPGDGDEALANAVATVLRQQGLAVVDNKETAELYVECDVAVSPPKDSKQHIKIIWHVGRAGGAEIGTVGQENDVPIGLLSGAWGDVAYSVAIAAGDGLMQLVARGTPVPKS